MKDIADLDDIKTFVDAFYLKILRGLFKLRFVEGHAFLQQFELRQFGAGLFCIFIFFQ